MLNRRSFVAMAAGFASSLNAVKAADNKMEDDVAPPEDLMREHGVLSRILLIYDHACDELAAKKTFQLDLLHESSKIIQSFIENYHEKLEEDYLFPRFEKAKKHVELVHVLKSQHIAGRRITAEILELSNKKSLTATDRQQLSKRMHDFVRMYRPHEAREDTVIFPALREIVLQHEFAALGEQFEKKEHELFGKEGFEGVVIHVGEIEKKLGIYDLAQFTPS